MKIKVILILFVAYFFSCKENLNTKKEVENFYPFSIRCNGDSYLSYDVDENVLLERNEKWDSLSNLHILEFKKDSIFVNTEKVKLPNFYKGILISEKESVILNTMPRTLGENRKSTDFLTKYDQDFQVVQKKDMNISKYPSGNCFIIGNEDKLFYITDGFRFKGNRELIVSQLSNSLDVINLKTINRQKIDYSYDPVKCIFIENKGVVVVSDISGIKDLDNKAFRIEMFDLDLNRRWHEDLKVNTIRYLGHSKVENKIVLVTEKEGKELSFWDYMGDKQVFDYNLSAELIDITLNDRHVLFLEHGHETNTVTKIDFLGKVVDKIKLLVKLQTGERKTNKLVYRQNQLFLVRIDGIEKLLTVNKL